METEIVQYPLTEMDLAALQQIRKNAFQIVTGNKQFVSVSGELYAKHYVQCYSSELIREATYETLSLRRDQKGTIDHTRIKQGDTYKSTNKSGEVYHIGVWASQGNHNGPDVICSSRELQFLQSNAMKRMERICTNMLRCTMPEYYDVLMSACKKYPNQIWKHYNGQIPLLQTVPAKGVNVGFECGLHTDSSDHHSGHCLISILGDVPIGEGGIGIADLMVVCNSRPGSLTHFNSCILRHWVGDTSDSSRCRISHVDFAHNAVLNYLGYGLKQHEFKLDNSVSKLHKTAWSHVIGRVIYKNKHRTSEKEFLKLIGRSEFLKTIVK